MYSEEEIYTIACQHLGYDNAREHDRQMFVQGFKKAIELTNNASSGNEEAELDFYNFD